MASTITPETLEFQSNHIERVLAAHHLPAQVQGGAVTPRAVRFNLTLALGGKLTQLRRLSEELALALGAPDVRVTRQGETLALEVPRPDFKPVRLLRLLRSVPEMPPFTATLGLADDGRPLLLRLSSPTVAHVLIAGCTGSGKTELMRSLLASLALTHKQAQLQMLLIDPKTRGLAPLANLPHCLTPLINEVGEAVDCLELLLEELQKRDRQQITLPRVVIAIDELAELLMLGGARAESALTRLAQRGREAGLHLVAGVQKPAAGVVGTLLKANFPTRLVGRVSSAEDARVAAGRPGTHAERLMGRGDFLAVCAGTVTRFQAAWLSPQDWTNLKTD